MPNPMTPKLSMLHIFAVFGFFFCNSRPNNKKNKTCWRPMKNGRSAKGRRRGRGQRLSKISVGAEKKGKKNEPRKTKNERKERRKKITCRNVCPADKNREKYKTKMSTDDMRTRNKAKNNDQPRSRNGHFFLFF